MSLVHKNFNFEGVNFDCFAIITSNNNLYCKLKDIAELLEYVEPKRSYDLVEHRWRIRWADLAKQEGLSNSTPGCSSLQPNTIFVSEPGIYNLMIRSKKPQAIRFRYHVLEVVLPDIRKTGAHISPNINTPQLDNIIETLQETREALAEKDRLLEETLEKLDETRGVMAKIQAEHERMAVETREVLAENSKILAEERQQKCRLQNNMKTVRPKVAVIPDSESVRHTLGVFKHYVKNIYKCVRTQNRNFHQAFRRIPGGFRLERKFYNVPNAINIINRLRELLPNAIFRRNEIISDANVINIIAQCIETEINRPIVYRNRLYNRKQV